MQPNCFIATTASTLAIGGSETELFLSNITTLTGEIVTTAQFATMGRGVITVDPLSTTSIEFMSFTGVDQVGVGFTGLTRGLSSLSNSVVSTNIKYHPIGTQVIIAFGVHNLLDLKTYITNVTTGGIGNSSNLVAGTIYSTANNANNRPRALSSLVQQQNPTVNMTLLVQNFSISTANVDIVYAGGSTTTYTAPGSNPRIDLLTYNTVTSALAYRTGAEASTPIKPTPSQYDIVLASIYHKVGEVGIKDTNDGSNGVGSYGYIQSWYYPSLYNLNQPVSATASDYSDGDVTISTNTSLTRDMYYNTLTVNTGITLTTAGYRIFARNVINNGTIDNSGAAAVTSTHGAGGLGGTLPAGTAGKNGAASAGTAGTTVSLAIVNQTGAVGGNGGDGAGAGGTVSTVASVRNAIAAYILCGLPTSTTAFTVNAGSGAGGSGGAGSSTGGASGGGGGIVYITSETIINNGIISSNGGVGGAGTNGNSYPGGGGGGGVGGAIIIIYSSYLGSGALNVNGGVGGLGTNGATTQGATGANGLVIQITN